MLREFSRRQHHVHLSDLLFVSASRVTDPSRSLRSSRMTPKAIGYSS
jgi:hypothetical protein